MRVRIVLADDHGLFREGIRTMLSAHPNFEVVGEAEDGATAIRLAAELFPDLVLMDVGLPVVNGIHATARILAHDPNIAVVALSVHSDPLFVEAMLDAGATGYVVKKEAFQDLTKAVEMAMDGLIYLSPALEGVTSMEYASAGWLTEQAI